MKEESGKSHQVAENVSSQKGKIDRWLAAAGPNYTTGRESLIPLLQSAQSEFGYLPQEVMDVIGRHLRVPPAIVQGVATFYAQFRYEAPGKHRVIVCRGTACHVRGSARVVEELSTCLNVEPQQTSKDGLFTLETVACLGSCALAPLVVVDGKVHGRQTPASARKTVDKVRQSESQTGEDAVKEEK